MTADGSPSEVRTRRLGLLYVLVLSLWCYGLLWLEPLWLGSFDVFGEPASSVTVILGRDLNGGLQFVAGLALPLALYAAALALVSTPLSSRLLPVAVAGAVALSVVVLYTYPAFAADVFDYLFQGYILVDSGLNPYSVTALDVPESPYYAPVGWKDLPSVYGPLWVYLSGGFAWLAGDNPVVSLVAEKLLVVAAHLGAAAFVYLIARRLSPGREVFAFVAYAWNPVVIMFTAIDGHNDSLLMLYVLAAIYLGLIGAWGWALALITCGAMVKFVPAILFPLFLYHGRREPQLLAAGLMGSAAIALVLFTPLWIGLDTFDALRDQASRATSSPSTLLAYAVPDGWVRVITTISFAAGYVLVLRYVRGLAQGAFAVFLLYLVVASSWTKGWYFIWTIATAATFGGVPLLAAVLAAAGAFLTPLFGGWGWINDWFDWQQRWGMPAMEIALTVGTYAGWLPLAWWLAMRTRRNRLPAGALNRTPEPDEDRIARAPSAGVES